LTSKMKTKWIANISLVISYILLFAHFFRAGNFLFAGVSLLAPVLLLFHSLPSRWILTAGLALGVLEWVSTFIFIRNMYSINGIPFTKAGLILGGVILFTLFAFIVNLLEAKKTEKLAKPK